MTDLAHLPEDILVLVFQQCRINDVFALRLTNKYFKNILTQYARSILPPSAHLTISKTEHQSLYWQVGKDHDLHWLKRLIPRYLATTLLENPSFRSINAIGWSSILGVDPLGNGLRSHLENGWRVLKKLSNISLKVYSPPVLQVANSFNQQTWSHIESSLHHQLALGRGKQSQDFSFISQKEDMVAARRLDFVNAMSQADAVDYTLLMRLLSKSLRYHPRFDADRESVLAKVNTAWAWKKEKPRYDYPGRPEPRAYVWYVDVLNDAPCPIIPWIRWFIMHIGPDPFFKQWTSHYEGEQSADVDHVAGLAWSMWEGQDANTIYKRGHAATNLDITIRSRCLKPSLEPNFATQTKRAMFEDMILRGMEHKLFVKEALLPNYFMEWRASGGENVPVEMHEDDREKEDEMVQVGRHPRESVPFFAYLGREMGGS